MAIPTPQVYINQAGFAARAHIARQAVTNRLHHDLIPPPDIKIGNVLLPGTAIAGWLPRRVKAYLAFIKPYLVRLDATRHRLRLPADVELPGWWHADTEWYLNQKEAAEALGLQPGSVSMRLSRGTWPVPPRVAAGDKFHGIAQGWDLADLTEYGQGRYLDTRGRVADVAARNGPPRKRIDPVFYLRRSAQRQARELQPV